MYKVILIIMLLFSHLQSSQKTFKVLFDLTTSQPENIENRLIRGIITHKNYFSSQLQDLEVAVIIHGNAYRFFLTSLKDTSWQKDKTFVKRFSELKKRLVSLHEHYHVNFYMCNSGRIARKITQEMLMPYVQLTPNAAIALIEKQNAGYAYIPLH